MNRTRVTELPLPFWLITQLDACDYYVSERTNHSAYFQVIGNTRFEARDNGGLPWRPCWRSKK
jgi:hypothetical protein